MAKQDLLEFKGKVIDLLPNAMFRVQLDENKQIVTAHTAGKLRKIEFEFCKVIMLLLRSVLTTYQRDELFLDFKFWLRSSVGRAEP